MQQTTFVKSSGELKPDKYGCNLIVKGDGVVAKTAKPESKTSIPKIVKNLNLRICKFPS